MHSVARCPGRIGQGTVHHGVPTNLYTAGSGDGGYLAFIGRISPERRPGWAIEISRRTEVPLMIAAKVDKADEDYFHNKVKPLLDSRLVEFVGEIGHGQKQAFFGEAMAVLFPIDWPEPFGLTLIEAMACGNPGGCLSSQILVTFALLPLAALILPLLPGTGTYRAFILALIEELDLGGRIRLVRAAYADMPRLYAEADVVIYPTIGEEPYGLVPLEAMSCDRSIVASRSGEIPETVVDGVTGFTVAPGDVSELADRVGLLLSSPEVVRRMARAGRERVMQDFDAAAYVDTLLRRFCVTGVGSLNTLKNRDFAVRAQGC